MGRAPGVAPLLHRVRSSGRPGIAVGGQLEHKLVAARAAPRSPETREHEPVPAVEVEDLFRFRDLEWITAEPVDPVVPHGHATPAAVLRVLPERIPTPHEIG